MACQCGKRYIWIDWAENAPNSEGHAPVSPKYCQDASPRIGSSCRASSSDNLKRLAKKRVWTADGSSIRVDEIMRNVLKILGLWNLIYIFTAIFADSIVPIKLQ